MNKVQLMVSKALMFHENTDMFSSCNSYYLSPCNNDPTKNINIVLVWRPIRNQFGWLKVSKEN